MQYRILVPLSLLSLAQAINLPQIQTPTAVDEKSDVKAPPADIPMLGFGTWSLPGQSGIDAVQNALKIGYRHLDGATAYGNQVSVGKGIAAALAANKALSRSDIWVTTKLWSNRHGNMTESGIVQALEQLNLTYVDLTLMHFPVGNAHGKPEYDIVKTWEELEKLVKPDPKTGVIRSRKIGISNFNVTQLEELLAHATIKPYVHQLETHPYLQQQSFIDLHTKHGIKIVAYAPFGNTNPEYRFRAAITAPILEDSTLKSIAKARGCASAAQVALAWNLKRGVVVIPKSGTPAHQVENYNVPQQCKLTPSDMTALKAIDKKARYWDMCCYMGLPCYLGLDGACARTPVVADYCVSNITATPPNTQFAKAPWFTTNSKAADKSCPKLPGA